MAPWGKPWKPLFSIFWGGLGFRSILIYGPVGGSSRFNYRGAVASISAGGLSMYLSTTGTDFKISADWLENRQRNLENTNRFLFYCGVIIATSRASRFELELRPWLSDSNLFGNPAENPVGNPARNPVRTRTSHLAHGSNRMAATGMSRKLHVWSSSI